MNFLAILVGGCLGTLLRYGMGKWIPAIHHFQLATVAINLVGCLFLGWFFTWTLHRRIRPEVRLGIGTGFTGAFTTFSTFSVHTVDAWQKGYPGTSILYLLISVAGGLLMSWLGIALGREKPDAGTEGGRAS